MSCVFYRKILLDSLFDDTGMFSEGDDDAPGNARDINETGESNEFSIDCGGPVSVVPVNSVDGTESERSGTGEEGVGGAEAEVALAPYSGMVVRDVIEAFVLYSNYARRTGFEIRFRCFERKRLTVEGEPEGRRKPMRKGVGSSWFYTDYSNCSRIRLQCVKGERPRPNRRDPSRPVRSQASGCSASVSLLNNGEGTWSFGSVKLAHNHTCDPETTRFMKNYKIVRTGDEVKILVSDSARVNPSRIYMSFAVANGGVENVPFLSDDCRSVVRKFRRRGMEDGDFNGMQKLFNEMIVGSKDFFYLYDKDDEGRVKNVFWADGRTRLAYKDFGDVVCFDTTHLKNRYKMPLASFIGVNHHGQSILLGLALISLEDTENFIWVFQAWMKCMNNRHPKCIMTDQCQTISSAVGIVFPNSRHRWCLWHIMRNGDRYLHKLKDSHDIRRTLKEVVHDSANGHAFEIQWTDMVKKFNLESNEWVTRMFLQRDRWVPVYFIDEFWAGLHSTQRSEGMNNFFRTYVNLNTSLREFAEQYCLFVGKRGEDEEHENWRSFNRPVLCATTFPCERVLQKIYTSRKFLEIQKEAKGVAYTNIELETVFDGMHTYMVTDQGVEKVYGAVVTRRFYVEYNEGNHKIECECKLFSFRGIICRHMIAVWQGENLRFVSEMYILDRWRKDKFREYSVVKLPNYAFSFQKSAEHCKVDEIQNLMSDVISLALGSEELYTALMPGLEIMKLKCEEFIANTEDLRVDSVGRFYTAGVSDAEAGGLPDIRVEFVLDPPDRRGKGRVPSHLKGYRKSKKKKVNEVLEVGSTH